MFRDVASWLRPIDVHRFRKLSFEVSIGVNYPDARKLRRVLGLADRFVENPHPDAFLAYGVLARGLRSVRAPVEEFEVRLQQLANLTFSLQGKCNITKLAEAIDELNVFMNKGSGLARERGLSEFKAKLDEFFESELELICAAFNAIDRNVDFYSNFRSAIEYWTSFHSAAENIIYAGPGFPSNIMQQIFQSLGRRN